CARARPRRSSYRRSSSRRSSTSWWTWPRRSRAPARSCGGAAHPLNGAFPKPPRAGTRCPGRRSSPTSVSLRQRAAGAPTSGRRGDFPPLLDLGRLAPAVAEVVELGAPHVTQRRDLDPLDGRGVHREGALHADAVADLAHGERLPQAGPLPPDDRALEDLDAALVAF